MHNLDRCVSVVITASAVVVMAATGCGEGVLSLDDIIGQPGGKTRLIAHVEREPVLGLRSDVKDIEVEFFADGRKLGHDKTDEHGRASIKFRPRPPGDRLIETTARVDGKMLKASARVFEWREDVVAIAVDIDNTISRTDYEELVFDENEDDSHPIKSARKTLRALSADFQILYLTARPRFLFDKTRQWLDENEFPPGPLVVAPGLRAAMRPEAYKRDALKRYRDDWPNILIGIGDKPSDAKAYGENRMLTLIVTDKEKSRSYGRHAVCFRKWKEVDAFFKANKERLADPKRLKDIIKGKAMIECALEPYQDD